MNINWLNLSLTVLLLLCRVATFVTSPLWIDAFRDTANSTNASSRSNHGQIKEVDPYFVVLIQGIFPTIVFGLWLAGLILVLGKDQVVTDVEKSYPKKNFILAGLAQALSAIIINYALSGTRSPPYLIALFGNFIVPIQFITRFFIIGRKPTKRKLLCAAVVVGAEFLCLLPSIFPSLENAQTHEENGGASGVGALLWPLSYVLGLIPGAMVNALMERSVKDVVQSSSSAFHLSRLNMAVYLLAFSLAFLSATILLVFVDFIPGYGGSHADFIFFLDKMRFNFACLFGGDECGVRVVSFGWATLVANNLYLLITAYILRHSEGANYVVVTLTLRSPILFLIWTLVEERPLAWLPHTSLSTWLSLVALCVMVPAVYLYNTGPPEIRQFQQTHHVDEVMDERRPLVNARIQDLSQDSWVYASWDGLR